MIIVIHIPLKGTISVPNTTATSTDENNIGIKVIFKNCAPFTDYISEINNTQVNNAKATLSTEDNKKLLQQSKSVFKRTINWNKYQSKVTRQVTN